jgi:hypothetical protein
MTLKERIHQLVDDLPKSELPVAERFLEYLRDAGADPLLRALATAEPDDEPLTAGDAAVVSKGRAAIARGDVVPAASAARRR